MSPLSALFLRHRDRLAAAGPLLWINPPPDLPDGLEPAGRSDAPGNRCFTQDETARRALAERGFSVTFGAFPPATPPWRRAVLDLPREKALVTCLAQALAAGASEDAVLYAAGEIRAGARSAASRLERGFGTVRKIDSARHCVLYECTNPTDEPFDPAETETRWALSLGERTLEICSYPGVFSHGRLDDGTALLLGERHAILAPGPERVLDVGCGAGVIGAALLDMKPAIRLVCSDSSALALASTRATLAANGMEAEVIAADGLRGVPGRFDLVISNPPFHAGHRERRDLGSGVFEGIRTLLNQGGRLVLVVNRHLPWPDWLDRTFGRHEVLAANSRFQVLCARAA